MSSFKNLGIEKLGVAERLDLIGEIWDSLVADPSAVPVPAWHRAEIERELKALAADGNPGRPADEVIADIKRRL